VIETMPKKTLTVNTRGLAKNLKHGTDHNETTIQLECPDNMITSILKQIKQKSEKSEKYKPNMYIKFTKNIKLFMDNGVGAGPKKMDDILKLYNHHEDEGENTIGNFGIGLKQMLTNLLDNEQIAFIVSKNNTGDYSSKIITSDGVELFEEDSSNQLSNNQDFRNLMDEYIKNTGFLILIVLEEVYTEWNKDEDITYYIDLFKKKMDENISDKCVEDIDYENALKTLYQDLPENIEFIFNDKVVEFNKFITNEILMFTTYIVGDKDNIEHKDKPDENDTIIAKLKYYKSSSSHTCKNRYYFGDIYRTLCISNFSNIDGFHPRTMNYIKCEINIINLELAKLKILKSSKTSTNWNNFTPDGVLSSINKIVSQIVINTTFLQSKGWRMEKYDKTKKILSDTSNLYHMTEHEYENLKNKAVEPEPEPESEPEPEPEPEPELANEVVELEPEPEPEPEPELENEVVEPEPEPEPELENEVVEPEPEPEPELENEVVEPEPEPELENEVVEPKSELSVTKKPSGNKIYASPEKTKKFKEYLSNINITQPVMILEDINSIEKILKKYE